MSSSRLLSFLALMCVSASLTACGGDDSGSAFLVRGNKLVSGVVKSYAACVETGNYIAPSSNEGVAMKNSLIKYYTLTSPWDTKADSSKSCRELDPTVNVVISMTDYQNVIVPATK